MGDAGSAILQESTFSHGPPEEQDLESSRFLQEEGGGGEGGSSTPWRDPAIIEKENALDNAALDSILNVNSFFTVAIFVGISSNSLTPQLAPGIQSEHCQAVSPVVSQLVLMLEVLSFGCFLTSTLFAVGLKVMINLNSNRPDGVPRVKEEMGKCVFRAAMLVSVLGLISGMVLMVLALIYYVEVYAGPFHCSPWAVRSILPLIIFTTIGILFILLVLFLFISWFYYVQLGTSQLQKLQTFVINRVKPAITGVITPAP